MPDRRAVGALFDGSFAGLLCVVHAYYYDRILPVELELESAYQATLGTAYVTIPTDEAKAAAALAGMQKKLTPEAVHNAFSAFLNPDPARFLTIFHYIVAGFYYGRALDAYEQLDYVLRVHRLSGQVGREAHLLKGFVRFQKTRDGIFYADITPHCDVLHILAEHFTERLSNERWILHDVQRGTAAVYNTNHFEIMDAPPEAARIAQDDGDGYEALWAAFYDAIEIRERRNPKLQRQMLPLYFRKNMTEHKLAAVRERKDLALQAPAQQVIMEEQIQTIRRANDVAFGGGQKLG